MGVCRDMYMDVRMLHVTQSNCRGNAEKAVHHIITWDTKHLIKRMINLHVRKTGNRQ